MEVPFAAVATAALDPAPSRYRSGSSRVQVPGEVEGQVSFVFNNLNNLNLIHHVQFVRTIFTDLDPSSSDIRPELWHWLARYIVLKRVPNEPNHHQVYMVFIDMMGESVLNECVSSETYSVVRSLLKTTTFRETERSSLRHLGRWMGFFFLGRNRPILSDQVDIKSLIVEACSKGSHFVEYVIPFITSIFDSHYTPKCLPEPQFFSPPNPWTVGILRLLTDVFDDPGLPTPTRYDIEILFKHMDMDVFVFERAHMLYDADQRARLCTLEAQMTPAEVAPSSAGDEQLPPPPPPANDSSDAAAAAASSSLPSFSALSPLEAPEFAVDAGEFGAACASVLAQTVFALVTPLAEVAQRITGLMVDNLLAGDFALETDERVLRRAAHNVNANLTAGLVLARGRDLLHTSLVTAFGQRFRDAADACLAVVNANLQLALSWLSRCVVHRAMMEFERRLQPMYEHVRRAGRRRQAPAHHHRSTAAQLDQLKRALYDGFGLAIPGFRRLEVGVLESAFGAFKQRLLGEVSAAAGDNTAAALVEAMTSDEDVGPVCERLASLALSSRAHDALVRRVFRLITDLNVLGPAWTARRVTDFVVMGGGGDSLPDTAGLFVLLRCRVIALQLLDSHYDQLLPTLPCPLPLLDHLHALTNHCLIERAPAYALSELSCSVVNLYEHALGDREFRDRTRELVDLLKINYDFLERTPCSKYHATGLLTLSHYRLGLALCSAAAAAGGGGDAPPPPIIETSVPRLFRDFLDLHRAATSASSFTAYVQRLNSCGVFRSDDVIARFLKICLDMCVDYSYEQQLRGDAAVVGPFDGESQVNAEIGARARLFEMCDGFVRLVLVLIRTGTDSRNLQARVSLLAKVFGIVVGECVIDMDKCSSSDNDNGVFNPLAYQRILSTLLRDVLGLTDNTPDHHINFATIHAYMNALYALNPCRAPAFTCSFIELVGNGALMNAVFNPPHSVPRLEQSYAVLLVALIRFLEKMLVAQTNTPQSIIKSLNRFTDKATHSFVQEIFTASLRLFLVILHDFPEFTCEYCYDLIDAIPIQFIQLRNLVLSAYSRQIRLPDPCVNPAKLDLIAMKQPESSASYLWDLKPTCLKQQIELFFQYQHSSPALLFEEITLKLRFQHSQTYNLRLLNAIVHHVASCAIKQINENLGEEGENEDSNRPNMSVLATVTNSSHAQFLVRLANALDDEGKYLLSTCMLNQLTYPNGLTQFYGMVIVHIFREGIAESSQSTISEIMIRCLTERLLVSRPHPWGLMMTFIELIKNPEHKLWQTSFVRWLPDIERIFYRLSRSAYQTKAAAAAAAAAATADNQQINPEHAVPAITAAVAGPTTTTATNE